MKRFLIALAAVGALAGGLVLAAGAGAQEGETPAETFLGRVAEKLGISSDELETAVRDVEIEMLDEALAEGRITQEQYDEMRERIENGPIRFPGGYREHHPGRCLAARFVVYATAELLGVETSVVVDGLQSGQSLAEIAEANGMGLEEFKAALLDEVQTELEEKVDEGLITQERADAAFEKFSENIDKIVTHEPDPDAPGPCRGHRGPPRDGVEETAEA